MYSVAVLFATFGPCLAQTGSNDTLRERKVKQIVKRGHYAGNYDRISRMAEREGFEPPVAFRPQQFSRLPVSTAHAPLRITTFLLQLACKLLVPKGNPGFSRPPVSTAHASLRTCL